MLVVTGGAGFIGSCLVWKLNQEGIDDIIIVDEHVGLEKEKNIAGKKFVDLIDKDRFLSLIASDKLGKEIEAIFHLGACSSTTVLDVDYLTRNNLEYSKSLAKFAMSKKHRFIYASSGATYGDGSKGFSDEDRNSLSLKPLNPYGRSKHQFDLWVIENGLVDKIAGLRYFNVFGPNEYHKGDMRSVITKAYDEIVRTKKMKLFMSHKKEYADGEQERDFIYVKDAICATYFFYENPTVNGIYNIGTGKARTWNDLAKALFSALGLEPKIEYVEMPDGLKERYQYFTQADIGKLRKAGYKREFYSLEDGIREYADFLKKGAYL